MNRQGRPRHQTPALAYDYRRAILLVQVLATMDIRGRRSAFEVLVIEWLHYPEELAVQVTDEKLLQVLAQHALEHARTP